VSEENKTIARKFFRMFEAGDARIADEIIATDYYNHDAPDPRLGREGVKAVVTTFKEAMADAQFDLAFQVAEGDKVVSRYTWTATHEGAYFGVAGTGKRVSWTQMTTFRIADGKICEAWTNWDQLGLMQRLGAIAPAGG
jgi:steroid delta-isomerase-like uncharacterized protein